MSFIEVWEHYQFGTRAERFVELRYTKGISQCLVKGSLPKSHGISYFYMREQCKKDLGEKMSLDLLAENPNMPYSELVELTKNYE